MKLFKDYTKEPYSFSVNKYDFVIRLFIKIQKELIIETSISEKIKANNSKIEQNKT